MSRFLRAFMTIYAAATIDVSVGPSLLNGYDSDSVGSVFLTAVSISHLVASGFPFLAGGKGPHAIVFVP